MEVTHVNQKKITKCRQDFELSRHILGVNFGISRDNSGEFFFRVTISGEIGTVPGEIVTVPDSSYLAGGIF